MFENRNDFSLQPELCRPCEKLSTFDPEQRFEVYQDCVTRVDLWVNTLAEKTWKCDTNDSILTAECAEPR